jgi:cobalt/nickel transport system permease protein
LALVAAGVFAAQALNFPLWGGMSGHVLGGALAGALLGPWAGVLVVALVVAVQCLVFHDGGITALGANVLNMAVLGPWLGHCAMVVAKRTPYGATARFAAVGLASVLAIALAATSCSVLIGASGEISFARAIALLLPPHLAIGMVEAALTAAVVFVLASAPRGEIAARDSRRAWRLAAAFVLLIAASVAAPAIASTLPDALESALAAEGLV